MWGGAADGGAEAVGGEREGVEVSDEDGAVEGAVDDDGGTGEGRLGLPDEDVGAEGGLGALEEVVVVAERVEERLEGDAEVFGEAGDERLEVRGVLVEESSEGVGLSVEAEEALPEALVLGGLGMELPGEVIGLPGQGLGGFGEPFALLLEHGLLSEPFLHLGLSLLSESVELLGEPLQLVEGGGGKGCGQQQAGEERKKAVAHGGQAEYRCVSSGKLAIS